MSDGSFSFRLFAAVLLLVLSAAACGWLATRFEHVGAPLLYACAGILALAAAGLAARRYSAWLFAVGYCYTATTIAVVAVVALVLDALLTRRPDVGGVLNLLEIAAAVILMPVALTLLGLSVSLARKPPVFAVPDIPRAAVLPLVAVSAAVLVWTFGYEGYLKLLPQREICLGGDLDTCVRLASLEERFTATERAAFARIACEGGEPRACKQLEHFLWNEDDPGGVNMRALQTRCERGHAEACLGVGKVLVRAGQVDAAAGFLLRGCDLDVATCGTAVEALGRGGPVPVVRALLESACARREMQNCRLLLIRFGDTLDERLRKAIGLEVCLATDVNACLPLMRENAAAVCPDICDGGGGENRRQSCDQCGRTARSGGRADLAAEWFGANCLRGYPVSCENLADMLVALGRSDEARPWFAKARELARTSGGKRPTTSR